MRLQNPVILTHINSALAIIPIGLFLEKPLFGKSESSIGKGILQC